MLITDFSAGELSKNLYGRVDVEAYYKGVSRLENFDVAPAGGIKKRGGTRRLASLGAESRLIPFVISAGNSYLLQLTDGEIRVWKNGADTGVRWTQAALYEDDKAALNGLKAKAAGYQGALAGSLAALAGAKAVYAQKETAAGNLRPPLEAAAAALEAAEAAYEAALDGAAGYRDAAESSERAAAEARAAKTGAEAALEAAETALAEAETALDAAESASSETAAALENAMEQEDAALAALLEEQMMQDQAAVDACTAYKEYAEAARGAAAAALEGAEAALAEAETAAEEAQAAYNAARAQAGVDGLYADIGVKQSAYNAAVNTYSAAVTALAAAGETLDNAQNKYDDALEDVRRSGLAPDDIAAELLPVSPLYRAADIPLVQSAQTENSIILVHPGYPPVMIKQRDGVLSIRKIFFDYKIDDVITDAYGKKELYAEGVFGERCFSGAGNYPACIAFYGSRLVLSGCKNRPQTIFVSNAPDDSGVKYNRFAMAKRAYSIVQYLKDQDAATVAVRYDWKYPDMLLPSKNGSGTFANLLSQLKYELTAYYVISYDMEIKAGTKFRFNIGVLESGGWSSEVLILPSGSLGVKKLSNDDLLEEWKKWVWENEEIYRESGFYIGGSRVAVTVRIEGTREKVRILGLGEAGYDFSYDTTRAEYAAKFMEMGSQIYMSNEEENLRVTAYQLWDEVHGAKEGKKFVYEGVETSGGTWQQICDSIRNREGVGVKEFQILLSIWKNPNVPEYEYKRENETKVISADCAFNFELASDTSDEVRWLANSRALIAGTQAAEWYIPPGVNALNIRAEQRSRNGSGRLQAVQAAEILAFAQSGRKKIKTCYVPEQEESYRTGDIMELNPEIISESAVKYMDFSSTPESRLFVVKDDGTMAVCLIEGGRAAWSRFVLGRGRIESAAVVPGASGEDEVYLAAETGGVRYLLVVDESIHSDNYYSGNGDVFRSVATSMPVAAGDPYGKKRITGIAVRFNESSMPKIVTDGRVETITGVSEPYSGIVKRPAPSSWDRDVFFTLEHDKDAPCVILAVNAEAG